MASIPPRLPWAPLEAADKAEKKATIPVAVIWTFGAEGEKKKGPANGTSIEINDRDADHKAMTTNHSKFASWEKVRMELGGMEVEEVEVPIMSER